MHEVLKRPPAAASEQGPREISRRVGRARELRPDLASPDQLARREKKLHMRREWSEAWGRHNLDANQRCAVRKALFELETFADTQATVSEVLGISRAGKDDPQFVAAVRYICDSLQTTVPPLESTNSEAIRDHLHECIEFCEALIKLLELYGGEDFEALSWTMTRFFLAMSDLEKGHKPPAWLAPAPCENRPPAHSEDMIARRHIVLVCDVLVAFGSSPARAAKEIAQWVGNGKLRRGASPGSILRWRREHHRRARGISDSNIGDPQIYFPEIFLLYETGSVAEAKKALRSLLEEVLAPLY